MNKIHSNGRSSLPTTLAAGLMLAMAFTLNACSFDDGRIHICPKKGTKYNAKTEQCEEVDDKPTPTYSYCNGKKYNSATQFCSGNKIYDKCGYWEYDPSTQYCKSYTVFGKCSGKEYNVQMQFCSGNAIFDKCGDREYDPSTQFCRKADNLGTALLDLCGGKEYDDAAQFCSGNKLYDKCGGQLYTPATESCKSGIVFGKCGSKEYNTVTQFCSGNTIYDKCGNWEYDPSTQSCKSNIIFGKCGSKEYNTATQFCSGNTIYDKCDGKEYNTRQFCNGITLFDKCNGKEYDPSTQFCRENVLFGKCGVKEYNIQIQFCNESIIFDKCNGKEYNTATQFCSRNTIYDKCGNWEYDPSTQFCSNLFIYRKCGGEKYDPSTKFCGNGTMRNYDGSITDARDGQKYPYVQIDDQIWMAANLNYEAKGSICYGTITSYCDKYGRLYDWVTAMGGAESSVTNPSGVQGICPSGWHLPSNAEWQTLIDFAGGNATAGTKLKSASGWDTGSGIPGTDDFGFSALPGGNGYSGGDFSNAGNYGHWWSSSELNGSSAYSRYMNYSSEDAYRSGYGKSFLFSVRCLRD
ncbi:MAG: fibrobacter succinogenes major paralogous domain-containing protein [Fibromonadaceae bacterium]|nr:fibrobacter succinogenes major paralogous domain-containing protein [Fibromonadaceae bacterium]